MNNLMQKGKFGQGGKRVVGELREVINSYTVGQCA